MLSRMNIKSLFYLIALTLITLPGLAQENFVDGYVLLTETDTLYGQVNNGLYSDNAQQCLLKKDGKRTTYRPQDIFGYRFIEGKFYISKELELDGSVKSVFLEFLIDGQMDIFFLQDTKGRHRYFAEKEGDKIAEITKEESEMVTSEEGKTYELDRNRFKGPLFYFTSDVPGFNNEVNKLSSADHKSLIKLGKKYHQQSCGNDDCIVFERTKKRKFKLLIDASGNKFFNSEFGDYNGLYKYGWGAEFLIQNINLNERLYVGIGYIYSGEVPDSYEHDSELVPMEEIPISINYIHPRKGLSPYFSYSWDLWTVGALQTLDAGCNYNMGRLSLQVGVSLKTIGYIEPIAIAAPRFGLTVDLN